MNLAKLPINWYIDDSAVLEQIVLNGYHYERRAGSNWYHVCVPIPQGGRVELVNGTVLEAQGTHLKLVNEVKA